MPQNGGAAPEEPRLPVLTASDYDRGTRVELIVRGNSRYGRVAGHRSVMGARSAVLELEVQLDGASSSIFLNPQEVAEKVRPIAVECTEDVMIVQDTWRRIALCCVFSMQPLVDPARGGGCRHPAVCNYEHLLREAQRTGKCPYLGCTGALSARRLVREDVLRQALQALPQPWPEYAWVSDSGDLRTSDPSDAGVITETGPLV